MKKILLAICTVLLLWGCKKEDAPQEKVPAISIKGDKELSFSEKFTTFTVDVISNSSWTYDLGGCTWISQVSKGDDFVLFQVTENKDKADRNATIVFRTTESGAKNAEASVKVKQAGVPPVPAISIDPKDDKEIPAEGAKGISIKVSSSLGSWDYDIAGNPEWIKASKAENTLTLDIAENTKETPRSATITFHCPDKQASKASTTLTINQKEKIVVHDYKDISTNGTANCYLVSTSDYYCFNATVRGNGKTVEGLDAPATLNPAGAKLVWQTKAGMIDLVTFKDGKVCFHLTSTNGNALIAATDASGDIIWSWHIWFPKNAPKGLACKTGDVMMEYNIGALSDNCKALESYGLLYQWGRKDPFPGAPVMNGGNVTMKNVDVYDMDGKVVEITHVDATGYEITGSHISYAIANPTVCIGNRLQYAGGNRDWMPADESNCALWGNPKGDERQEAEYPNVGSKSFYDPCPVGWRVAPIATYRPITQSGGMEWATGTTDDLIWGSIMGETKSMIVDYNKDGKYSLDDWTDGWHIYMDKDKNVQTYFPATTRYDGQYAMFMGSMVGLWGNYWTNTSSQKKDGLANAFSFGLKEYNNPNYSITISPLSSGSRADAFAVRCIKE